MRVAANQRADIEVLKYALRTQGLSRPCNHIEGSVERMDWYFTYLTQLYFFDQREFNGLLKKFTGLLENPFNELGWALRGYFAYLRGDFKDAAASFLEAIMLAPRNLDNWIDYAFALRHLGHDKASFELIFNTQKLMNLVLGGSKSIVRARLMKRLGL